MSKRKYNNEAEAAWNNANECDCGDSDCHPNNHRKCYICGKKMVYGAHESVESQRNSSCAWNVDHKIPLSKGGTNKKSNLIAVHVRCNRKKGNRY